MHAVGDSRSHDWDRAYHRWEESNHVLGVGGMEMDLGVLLPYNNVSFHARVACVWTFSETQRSVAPSVILPEVRGAYDALQTLLVLCSRVSEALQRREPHIFFVESVPCAGCGSFSCCAGV